MRKLAWFLLVAPLSAQELAVPVSGAAVSGSPAALRQVLGVGGASVLGDPLAQGNVTLAPGQRWAVLEESDRVSVLRMDRAPARSLLGGARLGAQLRSFSASGLTLASYFAEDRVVEIAGMDGAAAVRSTVALDGAAGDVAGLAVSDDGGWLVVVMADGSVASWARSWKFVEGLSGVSAVAILPNGRTALAADAARQKLVAWDLGGSVREAATLSAAPGSVMAVSMDGRRVIVDAADGSGVMVVNLGSGESSLVALGSKVERVIAGANGEFVIGGVGAKGVWVVNAGGGSSYVPPARAE